MRPIAVQRAMEFLAQFTKAERPDISRLVVEIQDDKLNPTFAIYYRNNKTLRGSLPRQEPLKEPPEAPGA